MLARRQVFGLVIVSLVYVERFLGFFFFFQAEDGIRDKLVTGVQTCALPISVEEDTFLVHRDSVVDADETHRYFEAVTRLVREHPQARAYLADVSGSSVRPLSSRSEERRVGKECTSRCLPCSCSR